MSCNFLSKYHTTLVLYIISLLHRCQTKEKLKGQRIQFRRKQIVRNLLSSTSQLVFDGKENNHVWVDSTFLRRFFSCQDGLGDIFQKAHESSTFLKSQVFLCEHLKGLHPRVARTGMFSIFVFAKQMLSFSETVLLGFYLGKMLSPKVYAALEAIIQEEYLLFRNHQDFGELVDMISDKDPSPALFDNRLVESSNLNCVECGLRYQKETRKKYDLLTVSAMHSFPEVACHVRLINQALIFLSHFLVNVINI